jgi:hypothetical protein
MRKLALKMKSKINLKQNRIKAKHIEKQNILKSKTNFKTKQILKQI